MGCCDKPDKSQAKKTHDAVLAQADRIKATKRALRFAKAGKVVPKKPQPKKPAPNNCCAKVKHVRVHLK